MKLLFASIGLFGALGVLRAGSIRESLQTEYSTGAKLHVSRETKVSMETTSMSFEIDGEPMDRGGRGGGRATRNVHRVDYVDLIQEVSEGTPSKIKRTFEAIEGEAVMGDQDISLEAPLNGLTLLLSRDDGEVEAELEEGTVEDDAMLEGHHMALSLDLLLPADSVAIGDEWEPEDGADLLVALGLDLTPKLFLPPAFERGGGGGRGGGRGGGSGRGMGAGTEAFFQAVDWDISASLLEQTEEYEGEECLVVKIEAEGSGELEEPERGGRGERRREFELGAPASNGRSVMRRGTEIEIEMSGKLLFSREAQRPIHFEIKGEISVESDREFSRGESTMRMQRSQAGTIEQSVTISEG